MAPCFIIRRSMSPKLSLHSESWITSYTDLLTTLHPDSDIPHGFWPHNFCFPLWTKFHFLFQKHINSPSGMAWCPKCSGYPQPMYILWLLVEVLNVSQPIFSIKLYQIVFLKRALMTFFLSKGTQWFHTVTKINYRFFNKMLKIFHTLAPDQYVGLTTSSSYYYTYLT